MQQPASILAGLLLALSGTTAQAQVDQDVLFDCLAHTYIVADRADRDAQELGTPEMIDAAQQYGAFSQALSYIMGTQDACETPPQDLAAEIQTYSAAASDRFRAAVADGSTPEEAFGIIQARVFECYEIIGDDAMQAAFTAVQQDGFPCGWGQ